MHIKSMTTVEQKVLLGTIDGMVYIFCDSEEVGDTIPTSCLQVKLYEGCVLALLPLPKVIERCVCPEEAHETMCKINDNDPTRLSADSENHFRIPNEDPDAAMIISIGMGNVWLDCEQTRKNNVKEQSKPIVFTVWRSSAQ